MLLCIRSHISTSFEGTDCLQAQIIRTKCNKCKESVSLENTNNVETYVVHADANKIKVICNRSCKFCDTIVKVTYV